MTATDLQAERKRLVSAQPDLAELDVKEREGMLIPADDVECVWLSKVMAARAKFLALPARIAPVVMAATTIRDVEEAARDFIYEALTELAEDAAEAAEQRYLELREKHTDSDDAVTLN